jgi:transposase-like protein
VLVELGLVEQRYQAVREVLNDGALVTDVARRRGVSRQTVHEWLVKYANKGLVGLMDRSSKPQSCPHQVPATARSSPEVPVIVGRLPKQSGADA